MSDEKSPDDAPEPGKEIPDNWSNPPAAATEPQSHPTEAGADLLSEEVLRLTEENADMKDRLLRTMADMENLRRRTEREKIDTARYAISNFARDVLSIGDNMERARASVPAEAVAQDPALKAFVEGVEMTERELLNVLERHGISRLDPEGERFDPNLHQAMMEVQDPARPSGTVVQVMQTGYVIGDRVLRPAMVSVSKGGPKASPPETSASAPDVDLPPDDNLQQAGAAPSNTASPEAGEQPPAVGGNIDKNA